MAMPNRHGKRHLRHGLHFDFTLVAPNVGKEIIVAVLHISGRRASACNLKYHLGPALERFGVPM
jgi:hypothetical protein